MVKDMKTVANSYWYNKKRIMLRDGRLLERTRFYKTDKVSYVLIQKEHKDESGNHESKHSDVQPTSR